MVTWTYCTSDDIANFLSASGLEAFGGHDDRGAEENAGECCEQATDEINLYVLHRYTPEAVRYHRMLIRWAVVMATAYLCERRGNPIPESIVAEYQRIQDKLEKIRDNKLRLEGVPQRVASFPAFGNLRIDQRYARAQIRVVQSTSTQLPDARRNYENQGLG